LPLTGLTLGLRAGRAVVTILWCRFNIWAQADREGRFVLGGMVPGSRCQLSAYTGNTGINELKEIVVRGIGKIELGDLVFDLQP
jgi:hypothetical protein